MGKPVIWKKEYIEGSEFIIEQAFWYQSNKNKEDRAYMRSWADIKLKACYDAVERGKEAAKKKSKKKKIRKNLTMLSIEEIKLLIDIKNLEENLIAIVIERNNNNVTIII